MLEVFGLDATAQDLYRTMLERPGLDVADLAAALGVDEGQIRTRLNELLDTGLLRESRELPGRMRAVDPEHGLELLLLRQEEELARRQQELAASRAAAARAVAAFGSLRPNTGIGLSQRLLGLDAVQTELDRLVAQCSRQICGITPNSGLSAAALARAKTPDQTLLQRGVEMRTLYQDSMRNDPGAYAYARWLSDLGGQVRTAPLLPPRMLLFDETAALVPIDPQDTSKGALLTREPGMLASLMALYRHAWDTAVPLGADRPTDAETGLTATEQELLKLLAGGLTDESAAKRLGVSLSTVRRQMAGLMERLNAASRFEAGLKAAQRGWL